MTATLRSLQLACLSLWMLAGMLPHPTDVLARTVDEARSLVSNPYGVLLQAALFDTRDGEPQIGPALRAEPAAGDDYFIVQFRDPLEERHRRSIDRAGGEILAYVPNRALLVRLSHTARATLAADGDVGWIGLYQPTYRLSPQIGTVTFDDPLRRADDQLWLTVDVFDGADLDGVAAAMRTLGAAVVGIDDTALVRRLQVRARHELLEQLARVRDVQWIEEWGEFTPRNDITRWVVQSNIDGLTSIWDHGLHGENQIVGHIDTRIKRDSCFFLDPIDNTPGPNHRKLVAYRSSLGYGQGSHGTHTAGTIAGDQEPIHFTIEGNGVAYRARISHSAGNDITGYGNTTSNLAEYLTYAHDDGARIHTNSWGDDSFTEYTTFARDIDVFSRAYEDDLVGFAVTNYSTLRTPENAKNCLAIGATYQAPDQHQHSSGGTGPTNDGRRKPEIYAPGRQIASARVADCATISSSGTSMACPAVMGAALLVRQYFEEGWYPTGLRTAGDAHVPTGALVKAMLLNATVDMDPPGYPTDSEGWGRLLLEDALFFDGDPRDLQIWDIRHADGLETGEVMEFEFETAVGSAPLRVTLVYTDEPAMLGAAFAPVNDLDLEVNGPLVSYKGNVIEGGWSVPGGAADPLNNVEMVLIEHPGTTRYVVRVAAPQVVGPDAQGFAVVVTGNLGGATAAVAGSGPSPPSASPRLSVRPNPFNPATTIDFSLPARGPVTLAIYDPAGRRVRMLASGLRDAGRYRVRWDGRNTRGHAAASGVYIVRLEQQGREIDARKIVLLQ